MKKWLRKFILKIIEEYFNKYYTKCDICKCIIHKDNIIKGKSEIKPVGFRFGRCFMQTREILYNPSYCHNCYKQIEINEKKGNKK